MSEPGGQPPVSPKEERRDLIWVGVAVLAVLLLGLLAVALLRSQEVTRTRQRGVALQQALDKIASADVIVVEVDAALHAPINQPNARTAAQAADRIPAARSQLEQANRLADQTTGLDSRRLQVARAARRSVSARLEMLDAAEPLLAARIQAGDALGPARLAWVEVQRAETMTAEAGVRFNQHTKASVTAAAKLASQAESQLASAAIELGDARRAMPGADFRPFSAYVLRKAAVVGQARRIYQLWLGGNVAEANRRIAGFNLAEQQAVAEASRLPGTPEGAIAAAYERLTAAPTTTYAAARARARRADTRIQQLTR